MFKVVALLAVVGIATAQVSVRDAVALQNQINTQNAINLNGALRNGILGGHVAGVPLAYSAGVPLAYSAGVPLAYSAGLAYSPLRVNDAVSLNSQIATQNAINVNGAVTGAINQQHQIATQNAINGHGAARNAILGGVHQVGAVPVAYSALGVPAVVGGVSVRDAVALNNQIATQNAINAGLIQG